MLIDSPLITGSITVEAGPSGSRPTEQLNTGSLFFNTNELSLEVYTGVSGSEWQAVGSGSNSQGDESSGVADIEYLLVAGGAAGGGAASWGAGGGGAGGYLSSSLASVTSGSSFTVTIGGGGGAVTNAVGTAGTDSSIAGDTISTITATGGGGGGGQNGSKTDGADGGSGGGAQGAEIYATPGSGTVGQGNDGGPGGDGQSVYTAGGGGGGATTAGEDASDYSDKSGGNGGTGATSKITGTSVERAGGGGGGTNNGSGGSGTGGTATGGGGAGGTGSGGTNGANGTAGTANTGGGGGGAGHGTGAAGGSGVSIFAYDSGSINGAGGIVGDAGNGRKYNQFNESGTFKVGSTSDFQIVTDSLVVHYDAGDFASRGTSTWTDLQGTTNGTVSGATLGANWYYDFDGSNDVVTLGTPQSPKSMEIWVDVDGTSGIDALFGHSTNTSHFWYWRTGELDVAAASSFTDVDKATGWTHIVVTDDETNLRCYVDGTLTQTIVGSLGTYNQIGGRQAGTDQYCDGSISQVRMYSDELTAAEVLQNYNATKTNFV